MTADFYDQLAPYYHLIFEDWQASIDRQGEWLDGFVKSEWPATRTVLDAAAGIGTQSLALAARGYEVTASDVSSVALQRARREAEQRGLSISTKVSDLRALAAADAEFDLVIACDNALPHLLSDGQILGALRECERCLRPGGGCLLSVRDYGAHGTGSEFHPHAVRQTPQGRCVLFQVWDWDGPHYDLSFYIVHEGTTGTLRAQVFRNRYYAVAADRILALLEEAGFRGVRRVEDGFYQPVLVGTKSALREP